MRAIFSAPEEDVLVTALCQGVEETYEILIQRYQQPVHNLVWRLLNDPSDTCDIVHKDGA
jgi:DNA-directed RNA polymerase specialized sigma24 family protein